MEGDLLPAPRRVGLFEVVAVLVPAALTLAMTLGSHPAIRPYHGVPVAILLTVSLSMLWSRRAPLAVAWISAATAIVLPLAEVLSPGSALPAPGSGSLEALLIWPPTGPFAAYAVTVHAHRRGWLRGLPIAVLFLAALAVPWALPDVPPTPAGTPAASDPAGIAFRSVLAVAVAALVGLYVSTRRRLLRGVVERAEQAERERLAAELHDVVTYRVSLMVLQAGALSLTAGDERTRAAAEELRATGCRALDELRDAVGLLRNPDTGEPAQPGTADDAPLPRMASLVEESAAVGAPVEFVEEGEPEVATAAAGRAAYRVVQEALTNARKHAPGGPVRVRISYRPGWVGIVVHNGPPAGARDGDLVAAGSGTGLLGLTHRVELVGGTLAAGPDGAGGFRVAAELPTSGRPAGAERAKQETA